MMNQYSHQNHPNSNYYPRQMANQYQPYVSNSNADLINNKTKWMNSMAPQSNVTMNYPTQASQHYSSPINKNNNQNVPSPVPYQQTINNQQLHHHHRPIPQSYAGQMGNHYYNQQAQPNTSGYYRSSTIVNNNNQSYGMSPGSNVRFYSTNANLPQNQNQYFEQQPQTQQQLQQPQSQQQHFKRMQYTIKQEPQLQSTPPPPVQCSPHYSMNNPNVSSSTRVPFDSNSKSSNQSYYSPNMYFDQRPRIWPNQRNVSLQNTINNQSYLAPEQIAEKIRQTLNKTMNISNNYHLRQALSIPASAVIKEDIIENTLPVKSKEKPKLIINNVDNKKLSMSLKSGLLGESTWALDSLSVLSMNGSFKIQSTPNILTCLIEYYKCFLNIMLDDLFIDTEIDFLKKMNQLNENTLNRKFESDNLIKPGDKVFLLDSTNYTFKTRDGLPVKLKKDELNLNNDNVVANYEQICDYQFLQNGNTLSTSYIVQTLEPLKELIPFIKKSSNKNRLEKLPAPRPLKRKLDFESESISDTIYSTLCPRRESLELLIKRCLCISNIIHNISFLPENARIMAKCPALMIVLARLLSHCHKHMEKKSFGNVQNEMQYRATMKDANDISYIFSEFSFETLHLLRMNSFVTLSNISEFLDLSYFTDKIILPLTDGLLHWCVCESSYARSNLPPDNLSCQIQALDIMAKLTINISNIDLILATPPFKRIENFFQELIKIIGKTDDVLRELALVNLSHFANGDLLSARIILHIDFAIHNLLLFIEQIELSIRNKMNAMNSNNNRSTTPNYIISVGERFPIKHAAKTLLALATSCDHSGNELKLFKRFEERFVYLTMSNCFDVEVVQLLAEVIFMLSN